MTDIPKSSRGGGFPVVGFIYSQVVYCSLEYRLDYRIIFWIIFFLDWMKILIKTDYVSNYIDFERATKIWKTLPTFFELIKIQIFWEDIKNLIKSSTFFMFTRNAKRKMNNCCKFLWPVHNVQKTNWEIFSNFCGLLRIW